MGVEYYVVDRKRFRKFELGKTLDITHLQGRLPLTPQQIYEALHARWSKAYRVPMDPDEERDWLAGLAALLWAFCESAGWQVEFRNDTGDYDDEYSRSGRSRYSLVYSRYDELDCVADSLRHEVESLAEGARRTMTAYLVFTS